MKKTYEDNYRIELFLKLSTTLTYVTSKKNHHTFQILYNNVFAELQRLSFHFTKTFIRASPPLGRKAGSRGGLWRAPSMPYFFLTRHSPTVTCILALHIKKVSAIFPVSLNTSGWGQKEPVMWAQQEQCSPTRIMNGNESLKSPGNQGRIYGEGWDMFFSKAALKGCRVPLTRQGEDALNLNP